MDQHVFEQCGKSTVRLHFGGGFRGTGFVVRTKPNECRVLTCAHVLRGLGRQETVKTYFSGENVAFECGVLHAIGGRTDLALLENKPGVRTFDTVAPLRLLEGEEVAPRQDVVVLGFYTLDDGVTPMIQPGTSEGRIIAEPTDETIIYTSSTKCGTSGSPVICSSAGGNLCVAGVHSRTSMGNSYAAPVSAIKEFLWDWAGLNLDEETYLHASIEDILENGPGLKD